MDDFKAIYRVLNYLQKAKKFDEFDDESFTAKRFSLTDADWAATLEILSDRGFIKDVAVKYSPDGYISISMSRPRITLSGLEYLKSDKNMIESANIAKGIS